MPQPVPHALPEPPTRAGTVSLALARAAADSRLTPYALRVVMRLAAVDPLGSWLAYDRDGLAAVIGQPSYGTLTKALAQLRRLGYIEQRAGETRYYRGPIRLAAAPIAAAARPSSGDRA